MLSTIRTANECLAHLYVPIMLNAIVAMLLKQAVYAFPLAQDSSGHQGHLG